jgi:P4 family phage/plasmid primase-like protien
MTLSDFYDVAKEDEKLKIACPFSDSSTIGAAWLVRGKTCVFLYCSSDHHGHDHRSEGVARWIYRAEIVFERGDEVEIADRLINDHLGDTAVFDQGALYRYLDDGTWRAFVNSEVESMAKGYAGSLVRGPAKNGQPTFKVLKLSHRNCQGVVKVVQETLHHHRFFEEAPPGIGFENGFMRLTDGVMVGHNPDHRLLAAFKLPFSFDPGARCPRWESFLNEVFDGDIDAPEKSAFLQEFCGAALFGKATDFQQHPLLYGPTAANGKSVFIETIGRLFPPDAQCASSPQDWSQPFGKAGLLNARINLVTEMSERELVDSGAMKAIMTGDSILYEQKYKPSFLYRPVAGHILAVNNLPASLDRSQGFYRRFVVVEFNRSFAPDEQDSGLKKKLLGELPGIAAWAIRGARRRFGAESYTVPVSSGKAMQEWRLNNDNVALFARTCLSEDPDGEVRSAKLYSRYKIWVLRQGLRPVSQRRFTQELRGTFPTRRRRDGVVWSVSVGAEA